MLHRYQRTQHFKTTNPKGIDKYNYISFFRKIQDYFRRKNKWKNN
nr:MAG TPA: hypothetical protein [Bacteriophage sp.]